MIGKNKKPVKEDYEESGFSYFHSDLVKWYESEIEKLQAENEALKSNHSANIVQGLTDKVN